MKCLSVSSFDKILQVGNIDISDDESADPEQREIAERVLEEAWPQGYADWEGRLPLDVSSPWLTCHAEEVELLDCENGMCRKDNNGHGRRISYRPFRK